MLVVLSGKNSIHSKLSMVGQYRSIVCFVQSYPCMSNKFTTEILIMYLDNADDLLCLLAVFPTFNSEQSGRMACLCFFSLNYRIQSRYSICVPQWMRNNWQTRPRSLIVTRNIRFKNSPFVNFALCDVHTAESNDLSWSCRSFHAADRFALWITISGLLTKILVSKRTLFMKKIFSINTVPVDF